MTERARSMLKRILAAVVMAALAGALSPSGAQLAGACLGGLLALAAIIDAQTLRLPNPLTASLVVSGLAFAAIEGRGALIGAVLGAVIGYGVFAALIWGHRRLRGHEGLGLGDAKLFAGAGAWCGWAGLPLVSLIAAVTGLAHFAVLALATRGPIRATPIPFGPHLCAATWAVWRFAPDGLA